MGDRSGCSFGLRRVHRTSAVVVGVFAVVHIVHHLLALHSIDAHLAAARVLRTVYRHPWLEPMLLIGVAVQWATGLALAYRRSRRSARPTGWVPRLQAGSGLVMAFFLPVHVTSVLQGRAAGLDTNFYFAAAGLRAPGWAPWFALYYGLAVIAVVLHVFIAIAGRARAAAYWPLAASAGAACGIVLVLALAGQVHPFDLPAKHRPIPASTSP